MNRRILTEDKQNQKVQRRWKLGWASWLCPAEALPKRVEVRLGKPELSWIKDCKRNKTGFVSTLAAKGSPGKLGPLLSGAEDLMTKDIGKGQGPQCLFLSCFLLLSSVLSDLPGS